MLGDIGQVVTQKNGHAWKCIVEEREERPVQTSSRLVKLGAVRVAWVSIANGRAS